jgi:rare lipoprotein A
MRRFKEWQGMMGDSLTGVGGNHMPTKGQRAFALAASLSVPIAAVADAEEGMASKYTASENGRRTASGIPFTDAGMTAAHKRLPFGTKVLVINKENGRSAVATITDRGPFRRGRIIDLSPAMARAIGMGGLARVILSVVPPAQEGVAAPSASAEAGITLEEPSFAARFDSAMRF